MTMIDQAAGVIGMMMMTIGHDVQAARTMITVSAHPVAGMMIDVGQGLPACRETILSRMGYENQKDRPGGLSYAAAMTSAPF